MDRRAFLLSVGAVPFVLFNPDYPPSVCCLRKRGKLVTVSDGDRVFEPQIEVDGAVVTILDELPTEVHIDLESLI